MTPYTHIGVEGNNGNSTDTVHISLPPIQLQSYLEWIRTSIEESLAEFYTILLEERLHVSLEILEVGICSSL
jgi:hypothetical protein